MKNIPNRNTLLQLLPELINISGYSNDYISEKMGLSATIFSARKQSGNWSADEITKLVLIIQNEEVEDYLMLQIMRAANDEEIISAEEFQKELRK